MAKPFFNEAQTNRHEINKNLSITEIPLYSNMFFILLAKDNYISQIIPPTCTCDRLVFVIHPIGLFLCIYRRKQITLQAKEHRQIQTP